MAIGVVQNAVPQGVFPQALTRRFVRSSAWLVRQNRYVDGTQQADSLVLTAREAWELECGLTAAQATALRGFYVDHNGPLIPFYFYDVNETSPLYKIDPTGSSTAGRYTVRFDGPWDQQIGGGSLRVGAGMRLIQVA